MSNDVTLLLKDFLFCKARLSVREVETCYSGYYIRHAFIYK